MSNSVMFSEIRLARNIRKYPFTSRLSLEDRERLTKEIIGVIEASDEPLLSGAEVIYLSDLSKTERAALVEANLANPEFISETVGRALVISEDQTLSIMIGGEDHIRIRVSLKGAELEKAYELADRIDVILDTQLGFAFSEKLGFLTRSPLNLGTGMRTSVVLHLPALQDNRVIARISANLRKLGLSIKGAHGESGEPADAMYRLSNTMTLGISEKSAIENLKNISSQLAEQEERAEERQRESLSVIDRVYRSLGVLRYARRMEFDEAAELLSNVRLGIKTGVVDDLDIDTVDRLFENIQPATFSVNNNSDEEINSALAAYIRKEIN